MENFEQELTQLLNRHNYDSVMNVPDYILADYLCKSLAMLDIAMDKISTYNIKTKNNASTKVP